PHTPHAPRPPSLTRTPSPRRAALIVDLRSTAPPCPPRSTAYAVHAGKRRDGREGRRPMTRRWHVIAVLIGLLALPGAPALAQLLPGLPPVPLPPTPIQLTVEIDPTLQQRLATVTPDQPVEAVLTFSRYPSTIDLFLVAATGVQTLPFRMLPMVGVRGIPAQIQSL